MRIASTADRKASLAPYARAKVGSEPVQRFFLKRTALLVSDPLIILRAKPKPSDPDCFRILAFGTSHSVASAIDRRGYFLTTSHSVGKRSPSLAFLDGDRVEIAQSRVVWRGDVSKRQPDLAVLHVPHRLEHVFEWAPTSNADGFVFATGLDADDARHHLDCISGRLFRVSTRTARPPLSATFFHDAPLHQGDSGGPLAAPDGRLLGINVLIRLSLLTPKPIGIAERPDLNWLHSLIEADASQNAIH
jgi:S1-C subfamily serine protease